MATKKRKKKTPLQRLQDAPAGLFKPWEQGYIAGCSDSREDKQEMIKWYAERLKAKSKKKKKKDEWLEPLAYLPQMQSSS